MSNWDMSNLNQPDPHEAVQRYRDARHAHVTTDSPHGPVTLERALLFLLIGVGLALMPIIALFLIAAFRS